MGEKKFHKKCRLSEKTERRRDHLAAAMTWQAMDTVGRDLGRKTVRHNAVVVDADTFAAAEAAGVIRMDQDLLAGTFFTNQQVAAVDLQDGCGHGCVHGIFHRKAPPRNGSAPAYDTAAEEVHGISQ